MNPVYYRIDLDDPAVPTFCTFSKSFFGTVFDIAGVVDRMAQGERCPDTVQAFAAFKNGDTEATHTVCYHKEKLMNPCTLIHKEHFILNDVTWEHENVWECTYSMAADHICAEQILLQEGEQYYRCVRATFSSLEYLTDINGQWKRVGSRIWGSKEIMQYFCGDHSIALELCGGKLFDVGCILLTCGREEDPLFQLRREVVVFAVEKLRFQQKGGRGDVFCPDFCLRQAALGYGGTQIFSRRNEKECGMPVQGRICIIDTHKKILLPLVIFFAEQQPGLDNELGIYIFYDGA